MNCIKTFLSGAWKFFTQTDVPGLGFSFAVLFVGVALIPISLAFLSLVLGFPVGSPGDASDMWGPPYRFRSTGHMELPPARKKDTR